MTKQSFYITTPIYYANAQPHIGTLYSTLLADVGARWYRYCGHEVFFLTGTDEHGQKLAEKAEELNMPVQKFIDGVVPRFKEVWDRFNLSYDMFIRTTSSSHKKTVTRWIEKLIANGDIYKGSYEGKYCVPCESFVAQEQVVISQDGGNELCPSCGRGLRMLKEENYFFKLSAYQDRLLAFYEQNPNFIQPKERLNEVISFVRSGLEDLSLSRKSVAWGIPFPGDEEHTVYVWGDALLNYLSALGYLHDDDERMKQFWPVNVQVMAKDIIRFHAVYFPAFLMAVGLEPQKKLLVHGYILVDEDKMSKSKGNALDPLVLADKYGVDQLRYYLTRYMLPSHDGNFTFDDLVSRINSDLANNLGNLLQRTASLALKYGATEVVPPAQWDEPAGALQEKLATTLARFDVAMTAVKYHEALAALSQFTAEVNAYFHEQQPWHRAKTDTAGFAMVIAATCQSLYAIAHMMAPVMPYKAQQLLAALGHTMIEGKEKIWENTWQTRCTLFVPNEPLFARMDMPARTLEEESAMLKEQEQQKKAVEDKKPAQAKPEQKKEVAPLSDVSDDKGYITIEDVIKVELIVGEIIVCEPLEKSKKLYRLEVHMGEYGHRQILAGVALYYAPEDLINKKAIFVANLQPRKLMGLESQGMMLCAKDDENFAIVSVPSSIANGTRIS